MRFERHRRFGNLLLQHRNRRIGSERQRTRQQAVEHHANGIEVSTPVDFLAEHLLRRHEGRRAHHPAVHGHLIGAAHARDAEVHDLHHPVGRDHDVGRLHVAVHDAGVVRVLEADEDLFDDFSGAFDRQRADALGHLLERLPCHELHHHQEIAVGAEQLVDGRDLRVIELGENGRLGAEPLDDFRVGQVGIEGLDGNVAVQRLVDGTIHDSRAAAANLLDDAVLADGPANHQWWSWVLRAFTGTRVQVAPEWTLL